MSARGCWVTALAAAAFAALPAVAHAGTVSSAGGVMRFVAAPGERNDISRIGGNPLTDAGARLLAGPGCTVTDGAATCDDSFDTAADLGDRDDRAYLDPIGAVTADGGEGSDDMVVDSASAADARGGPGDDRMTVLGNGSSVASGGPGDDDIEGGEGGTVFRGDDGYDTLVSGDAGWAELYGGAGDDRLTSLDFFVLDGGDGDDVLDDTGISSGNDHWQMLGGAGADVINAAAPFGPETVDAGPGDDRVHAWNRHPDGIACGDGSDMAFADPGDDVASDCETVVPPPRVTLAQLAAALDGAEAPNPHARRLLVQVRAEVRNAQSPGCYDDLGRLFDDDRGRPCLVMIVAAVRRLVQIPALAASTAGLVGIERDLAITRADDAAGQGAPPRRLQRAREDIAAAATLDARPASLRLRRVWDWLAVS